MKKMGSKFLVGMLVGTTLFSGMGSVADAASRFEKPKKFNYVNFKKDWNGKLGILEKQVVTDKWKVINEFSHFMDGKIYYSEPVIDEAHEEFNRRIFKYRDMMDAKIKKIDALQATLTKVDTTKERDAFLRSVKGVTYAKGQLHTDRVAMQDVVSDMEVVLLKNWYDSERLLKIKRYDLYKRYGNFSLASTDQKLTNYELSNLKSLGRTEMRTRLANGVTEDVVSTWYVKNFTDYEYENEVGITELQVDRFKSYESELYTRDYETLGNLASQYEKDLEKSYIEINEKLKKYMTKVVNL